MFRQTGLSLDTLSRPNFVHTYSICHRPNNTRNVLIHYLYTHSSSPAPLTRFTPLHFEKPLHLVANPNPEPTRTSANPRGAAKELERLPATDSNVVPVVNACVPYLHTRLRPLPGLPRLPLHVSAWHPFNFDRTLPHRGHFLIFPVTCTPHPP